jgi:ParB/RepB/Spo0J family partition protein
MSRDIELGQIRPDPKQPRQHFSEEKIRELAQSMKEGQAVPIAVRPETTDSEDGGGYVIIHGERRWRAAKRLGWETIAADVQDVSPKTARWRSLVENVQREDLTPIEEARAYRRQLDRHDLTQSELGERIGKSQSYVAQKLRLLRLPSPLSFFLESGALTEGHVRKLLTIEAAYLKGATKPMPSRSGAVEEMDTSGLQMSVNNLRPMDWPPFMPDLSDEARERAVRGALKRLHEFADGDGHVPAWIVAAWYWALLACCMDLSVSALADAVDAFTDRLESHVGFFFVNAPWHRSAPEKPSIALDEEDDGTPLESLPLSALQRVEEANVYFGALSDLRHTGALPALRSTWRHVFPEKVEEEAPAFGQSTEAELTEDELEENAEQLWECSGAVCREGRYLWPSRMNDPETREAREAAAARQYIEALQEPAV